MNEEDTTRQLDNNGQASFEERVMARFAMQERVLHDIAAQVLSIDSRLQQLEARDYDTRPIWQQALKEILETRQEVKEARQELTETKHEVALMRRELSRRMDRIESIALETRADVSYAFDRIGKLEEKVAQ